MGVGAAEATGLPDGPAAARPAGGAAWTVLPLVFSLWLLAWLTPSLLLAPHLATPRPWLTADTAPAALVAAITLFMLTIWPFWPALAASAGGAGTPLDARAYGRTLLEAVILLAVAAPFGLVAWSLGGRAWDFPAVVGVAAGLGAFGTALRATAARTGPGGVRWIIFVTTLVCVGPLLIYYAAAETMGTELGRLLSVSPIIAAVQTALGGGTDLSWTTAAAVLLAVILAFNVVSFIARRRVA